MNALKTLPLLALVALAAPLHAQDTAPEPEATAPEAIPEATTGEATDGTATAPEAPAGEATGATAPEPGGDLSLGEPADGGAPRPGEPYIREEIGDWAIRCLRAEEGPDPCQLYQLLQDEEGNNVAEISMFPLPPGREAVAGATIVTPLETLLTENLTLSVDGGQARRYPFTFCNAAGCVSRVGFTAEEVAQFRNGNAARVTIVPAAAPDQEVNLTVSLRGFTAGYDAAGPAPEAAE